MLREVNEIESLGVYRDDWARLLAETPSASFFQSLPWLETYWRHFGRGQRLRVLLDESAGRLRGIVPLVVRPESTRVGTLPVLTYPLHDWGSFYGPIGPEPDALLPAAIEHVCRRPVDWDLLELRWLGAPGSDVVQAAAAFSVAGRQAHLSPMKRTAVVDLSGTWDDYLASRPREWRRNLRAAERKLDAVGGAEFVRYRPRGAANGESDPRWDLFRTMQELSDRGWQARAERGTTLTHPQVRAFFEDAHAAAATAGAADICLLYVRGQPAAFMYGYVWRGRIYGLRLGYDPAFAKQSVGMVLMARALRDSFARGDTLYDLGVGALETKRPVQTRSIEILRLSHFRATAWHAQLLRLGRWWRERTDRPVRSSRSAAIRMARPTHDE